uniref:Polyprotein n=1 Tax=Ugandan cassava brown streak virus TaxID=946046 RepID=A0A8G1LUI3_9POTY|nr:polyprotein [Ugandan cassava brown streak virus]
MSTIQLFKTIRFGSFEPVKLDEGNNVIEKVPADLLAGNDGSGPEEQSEQKHHRKESSESWRKVTDLYSIIGNSVYCRSYVAMKNFLNDTKWGGLFKNKKGQELKAAARLRRATSYGFMYDPVACAFECPICRTKATALEAFTSDCDHCFEIKHIDDDRIVQTETKFYPINPIELDVDDNLMEAASLEWLKGDVEERVVDRVLLLEEKEIRVTKKALVKRRAETKLVANVADLTKKLTEICCESGIPIIDIDNSKRKAIPMIKLKHIFGKVECDDMFEEDRYFLEHNNANKIFRSCEKITYRMIRPGWSGAIILKDNVQGEDHDKFDFINDICVVQGKNLISYKIENAMRVKTETEMDLIDLYSFNLNWAKSKDKFIKHFESDTTQLIRSCCTPSTLWLYARKARFYKFVDHMILKGSPIIDILVKMEYVGKHLDMFNSVEDVCTEYSHFMKELISETVNDKSDPDVLRVRNLIRAHFESVLEYNKYELIDRIIEKKTQLEAQEIMSRELIRHQYGELFSWRERLYLRLGIGSSNLYTYWVEREERQSEKSRVISCIISKPGIEMLINWVSEVCKSKYHSLVNCVDSGILFLWSRIVHLARVSVYGYWNLWFRQAMCVLFIFLVSNFSGKVVSYLKKLIVSEKKLAIKNEAGFVEVQGRKEESFVLKWCAAATLFLSFLNYDWAVGCVSAIGKMKTIFSALGPDFIEKQDGDDDLRFTTFEVEIPGDSRSSSAQTFGEWIEHCIKFNLVSIEPTTSGPMLTLERGKANELADQINCLNATDIRVHGGVGTGKSTALPYELIRYGAVLVCVPTRVLANALHESFMSLFGFDVSLAYRGRVRTGSKPITIMTYGYALNHFHHNPKNLAQFQFIIMDEVHTFPVHLNPLFSLLRELSPDKKIIKTSATHVGHNVDLSTNHKVDIHTLEIMDVKKWAELQGTSVFGDVTREPGNVLVFVASYRDVDVCAEKLKDKGFPVMKVDGRNFRKNTEVQKMVDEMRGEVKFIVATNIIENGVTLDVDVVVDFGERISPNLCSEDRCILMQRQRISQAERKQRFGRVGRMKRGSVYKFGRETLPDSMRSRVGSTESALICFAYGLKPVVDDVDIGSVRSVTQRQALTASMFEANYIFTAHLVDKQGFMPRPVFELMKNLLLHTDAVGVSSTYLATNMSGWRRLKEYIRIDDSSRHVQEVQIPWYCSDMSDDFIVKLAECVKAAKPKSQCGYKVDNVDFHTVAHKISVGESNIDESRALVATILDEVKQWRDGITYHSSTPRNKSLMSLMVGWIPRKAEKTKEILDNRIQRLELLLNQLNGVRGIDDYESLVRFFSENPHSAEYLESQCASDYIEEKVMSVKRNYDKSLILGMVGLAVATGTFAYWYMRRSAAVELVEKQAKHKYNRDKRTGRLMFDMDDQETYENFGPEYTDDVISAKMTKAQKERDSKKKGWKAGKINRPMRVFHQLYGVNPLEFDEVVMRVGKLETEPWDVKELNVDAMMIELDDDYHILRDDRMFGKKVSLAFRKEGADEETIVNLTPHRSKMASSMSLAPMGFPEEEGRWRQTGAPVIQKIKNEDEIEVQVAKPEPTNPYDHVLVRLGRAHLGTRVLNCFFHGSKCVIPYHLAEKGDREESLVIATTRGQFDFGPMKNIKCRKITDYDVTICPLPNDVQPFRSKIIMREPKLGEEVVIVYFARINGKIVMKVSDKSTTYPAGGQFAHLWAYNYDGQPGDCGGPIVATVDQKVVGFHSGVIRNSRGEKLRAVYTPVNQELLNCVSGDIQMTDFWTFNPDLVEWNSVARVSTFFPMTKAINTITVQANEGEELIDGNLMIVGYVNREVYHNHVIKGKRESFTRYCEQFPNCAFTKELRDQYLPSILSKPAFRKGLLKYNEPVQVGLVNFPCLIRAYLKVEDMFETLGFRGEAGPQWDPIEILDDLNKKAAMGALYQGKKQDWLKSIEPADFITAVRESFKHLAGGDVGIWSGSLKAELRTVKKVLEQKTRVFTGAPIDLLLGGKILVDNFNHFFYFNHLKGPWTVGINKFNKGWDRLARYFNHSWNFIDCDGSRFDTSLAPILFQLVCHMREKFGNFDDIERAALRNLYTQIVYTPILTIDGYIVKKHRGNNSGQPSTVVDNTIILMIVVEYCKAVMESEGRVMQFKYMCNGDDLILNVPDDEVSIIQSRFRELFSECGLDYNFDDVHKSIETIEYMSHSFMLKDDVYIPKLKKERIVAILEWERGDEIMRTRSALNAAYIESYGYEDLMVEIERYAVFWAAEKGCEYPLLDRKRVEGLYRDDHTDINEEWLVGILPPSFEHCYIDMQTNDLRGREKPELRIESHDGVPQMQMKFPVTFVTGNLGKLAEVKSILGIASDVIAKNIDLPEVQGTPDEIVRKKAQLAVKMTNSPVLVEDTCLCFNAFNGLPGPYIKWFLKELGLDGVVRMLSAFGDKSAYALCTFAYVHNELSDPVVFKGVVNGEIVPPRGDNGFGWDPIFKPDGCGCTFAEMSSNIKNDFSHRRRALEKVKLYLDNLMVKQEEKKAKMALTIDVQVLNQEEIEAEITALKKLWKDNGPTRTRSPFEARRLRAPQVERVNELLQKLKDEGLQTKKRPCGEPDDGEVVDDDSDDGNNQRSGKEVVDESQNDKQADPRKSKFKIRGDGSAVRRDDIDKIPTNALEIKKTFKPPRVSQSAYIWIPRSQRDNLTPDVIQNFLAYIPPSHAIDNQLASGIEVENWAIEVAKAYGVNIQEFYRTVLPAWIVNCIVNGTSDERKNEKSWRAVELNSQGEDVDDFEYPMEPMYKFALPTMRKIMRNFSSQAILMYQNSVAAGKAFVIKAARNAGYTSIENKWLGIDFLAEAQLSQSQLDIKHQILAANVGRTRTRLFALAAPGDDNNVDKERHTTHDVSANRHSYSGAAIE